MCLLESGCHAAYPYAQRTMHAKMSPGIPNPRLKTLLVVDVHRVNEVKFERTRKVAYAESLAENLDLACRAKDEETAMVQRDERVEGGFINEFDGC